jgi:hypothetical protein
VVTAVSAPFVSDRINCVGFAVYVKAGGTGDGEVEAQSTVKVI